MSLFMPPGVLQQQNFAPPSTLLTGLISWWSLDETTGNRIDAHGGLNLAATSMSWAAGKVGNAAVFDGVNSFLSRAATPYALTTGTLAFWLKKDDTSAGDWVFAFNGLAEFDCFYSSSQLQFRVNNDTLPAVSGSFTITNWNHVILTWNTTTARMYINNVEKTSSSGTYTGISGSGNFVVGERYTSGQNWDGMIDELAIWNKIITADERAELYNGGTGIGYSDL